MSRRNISPTMRHWAVPPERVYRDGGDEFLILLNDISEASDAVLVADHGEARKIDE